MLITNSFYAVISILKLNNICTFSIKFNFLKLDTNDCVLLREVVLIVVVAENTIFDIWTFQISFDIEEWIGHISADLIIIIIPQQLIRRKSSLFDYIKEAHLCFLSEWGQGSRWYKLLISSVEVSQVPHMVLLVKILILMLLRLETACDVLVG